MLDGHQHAQPVSCWEINKGRPSEMASRASISVGCTNLTRSRLSNVCALDVALKFVFALLEYIDLLSITSENIDSESIRCDFRIIK